MIEHYSFGSITIDGKEYTHDVIVSSGKVKSWWRATLYKTSEAIKEFNQNLDRPSVVGVFQLTG